MKPTGLAREPCFQTKPHTQLRWTRSLPSSAERTIDVEAIHRSVRATLRMSTSPHARGRRAQRGRARPVVRARGECHVTRPGCHGVSLSSQVGHRWSLSVQSGMSASQGGLKQRTRGGRPCLQLIAARIGTRPPAKAILSLTKKVCSPCIRSFSSWRDGLSIHV